MLLKANLLSKVLLSIYDLTPDASAWPGSRDSPKQWHAQITHFLSKPCTLGLVDHQTGQERRAVLFQRDGQAFKPV